MRVVLAWDLGAGRGHAVRLSMLANAFAQRGDEVLLLARDLRTLRAAVSGPFAQLPLPHNTWFPRDAAPASWADILWIEAGLHDAAQANAILLAWRDLLYRLTPDLLLLDACPLAAPAARALGIPALTIGSGFMQPPPGPPWPVFRDWEPVDLQRIRQREEHIAGWCEQAASLLGRGSFGFEAERSLLFTYGPFDHYAQRHDACYLGPMTGLGEPARWPAGRRRVFVYLQAHYPYLDALHAALAARGDLAVLAYFGGECRWPQAGWLRQVDRPVSLDSVLSAADLIIGHGGTMAAQVAASGIPQLLLPIHAESFLLARRLSQLGAARMVAPPLEAADFAPSLAILLDTDDGRAAAQRLARGLTRLDDAQRCAQLVAEADALIAAGIPA